MTRQLLASATLAFCFASACGGAIAEPIGGEGSEGNEPSGVGRGSASSGQGSATGQASSDPGTRPVGSGESGTTTGADPGVPQPIPVDPNDPGAPTDPGDPNACFTVDASDVCSYQQTAKAKAAQLCASKGYALIGLSFGPKGHCLVTCCNAGPATPPPPPPAEKCSWTSVGDGNRCLSYGKLESRAAALCASQNRYPRSIYPANDCPKGATTAKVECCSQNP